MPANSFPNKPLSTFDKLRMVWGRMRQSCYDTSHVSYKNYGARGITVDLDAWPTGRAFAEWALVNGFEPGLTVERINSSGNYTPSNVTFATRIDQQRNRTVNVLYDYQGERITLAEVFERELGGYTPKDINRAAQRIGCGWEVLAAVCTPPMIQNTARYAYQGEKLALYELARKYLKNPSRADVNRIYYRILAGATVEDALTKPARKYKFSKPAAEHLI